MLEAFADDLPGLIVFENVPRIATRGRHLLDQIVGMLQHYGYATAETTHDLAVTMAALQALEAVADLHDQSRQVNRW